MTDGNEWFWVDGEAGTDSGRTYDTAELRDLARSILATRQPEAKPSDKPEPWWELLPAPTCPYCGGDTCDCDQRIEEADHAATE